MLDLEPHPRAAVEYWFWKLHAGPLAFLVDFILRPQTGVAETRVSLWLEGADRVIHAPTGEWRTRRDEVVIGGTELRPGGSRGTVEDVEWDLSWDAGATVVTPLPRRLARLEALDLSIVIRPDAVFHGHVKVGDQRFDVANVQGALTHYWGRRLPDRWIWLSATSFEDDPSRRVEAIVSSTRLFGALPAPGPIGLIWTRSRDEEDLVVWPLNGVVRARRQGSGFEIEARRLGGPRHRLVATWGDQPANDLGEGIIQTLHGDCTIDGIRAAAATVGVETRAWQSRSGDPPGSPP